LTLPRNANSAHSTILFLFKPASPAGIGGRSKVNKKVPVREPLCAIYREHPDRATLTSQR